MVAGQKASPKDEQSTERLMQYWLHGEGAAKVQWGQGNDWYRCVALITKAVKGRLSPDNVKGLCENLHVKATGLTTAQHTKLINEGKNKQVLDAVAKRTK